MESYLAKAIKKDAPKDYAKFTLDATIDEIKKVLHKTKAQESFLVSVPLQHEDFSDFG